MDKNYILKNFEDIAQLPDREIDLARAAFLIASSEYPTLNVERELFMLQRLAGDVSSKLMEEDEPLFTMNTLSEHLFDDLGFKGDSENYYDPRNSYLNDVVSRKHGIPITLSLVYIEVGRRLRMPLEGIGMPGHFLVRHQEIDDLFVDPFNGGILLSTEECKQRLKDSVRGSFHWDPKFLQPVTNREFLARIIRNLKSIYLRKRDHARALTMIEFALALDPNSASDRRDRGIIHYHLGNSAEALNDLQYYLESSPYGHDTDGVHQLVSELRSFLDD